VRTIRTALKALRRNPMRAALTALGIIIGVAAVIIMMEIGKGSSSAIQRTIASMGANNLLVHPGAAASGGVSFGGGSGMNLTPQDCDAIIRECPAVSSVTLEVQARAQLTYGNRNWVPLAINGTTPSYLDVRSWNNLAEGEMFTDRDVRNGSKVCVLGQTIVRELFQGASPIGREVRVKNVSFKVIGVLSAKGANMMGRDQDDILLAPWTTIKQRVTGSSATTANQSSSSSDSSSPGVNSLGNLYPTARLNLYPVPSATQQANTPLMVRFTNVDHILISVREAQDIPLAMRQVSELLRERHRLQPDEPDDFNIRDMTEMSKTLSSTSVLMANLLLSVALISLVVGGVGIMNIMLVSVTERTREIGLRMAVGARARDIMRQFLVEAVALCLAGGAIGIMLGCGSAYLVTLLLSWPTQTSLTAIVTSVIVSAGVGIIFGFYPAWKASRLDPIEALRYE
jgi:ABC-type antimicrobial peptide transport system permease subunit